MAKEKKGADVPVEIGVVLYTDGGCRGLYRTSNLPMVPVAGYGLHGYTFNINAPTPKVVKKSDVPSTAGYIAATAVVPEGLGKAVTPIGYYDRWGTVHGDQTNNRAELVATIEGLRYAQSVNAKQVTLALDSDYVKKGFAEHLRKWLANGWKTTQGTDVKNVDLWKQVHLTHSELVEAGTTVDWVKIAAHTGELGNTIADWNATCGLMVGRRMIQGLDVKIDTVSETIESQPIGYFSTKGDYNRMLSLPIGYFMTLDPVPRTPDGRYVYYSGTYGKVKETDQDGKRSAGHTFSVVYLKEPEPIFEVVREEQNKLYRTLPQQSDVVRVYQSKLFSSKVYDDFKMVASGVKIPQLYRAVSNKNDLYYVDDEIITSVASPALLAFRSVQYLQTLDSLLQDFIAGKEYLTITDVTDMVYSIEEVKNKEVIKLTQHIGAPSKAIKLPVRYKVKDDIETTTLLLTQVLDLPDRNALSALAQKKMKISVVTYRESDVAFRWAVVIEADGEIGIWSTIHSNLKLLLGSSS